MSAPSSTPLPFLTVIPAKAGIQALRDLQAAEDMDPRLRGDDEKKNDALEAMP
ncbi:MAG TPA: hypothetical protein VD978_04405 [Azospirillum sp.]|nr:hypothetical protein [Azospirillum sp.]